LNGHTQRTRVVIFWGKDFMCYVCLEKSKASARTGVPFCGKKKEKEKMKMNEK
jgi:hypothetical protein